MQCVLSDEQLMQLMRDDVPFGDLTTDLLLNVSREISMTYAARQSMTLCGVEEIARLFELRGATVEICANSGDVLEVGDIFLKVHGQTGTLFAVWKVAQILVEWASGVATETRKLVIAAGNVPVACTRKQNPGTKQLSIKAVKAGGGSIHRLGLSESILVFAEHRQFLAQHNPQELLQILRMKAPEQLPVVEVHSVEDALLWINAGVSVVQLDKFTVLQVAYLAEYCQSHNKLTTLAVAGGVNRDNLAEYIKVGANLIVTSSPYHAQPMDVQVRFLTK